MNNQFPLLNYLRAITTAGSISSAAKQLYISQPYLSRYIHEKEAELGITLLNRQTRPITLTDVGAKYLQGIENLDNQYNSLVNEVSEMAYDQTSNIRVGINQSLSSQLLPELITSYNDEFPARKIFVKEGPSNELEELLLSSQIDVQIRMLPIFPNQIAYRQICEAPVYLIANKTCTLYNLHNDQIMKTPFPIKAINHSEFVFLHSGSGFMRLIESFISTNRLQLKQHFEVKYLETAANLAYAGIGCTFVPQLFLRKDFNPNKCNVFKISEKDLSLKIAIAYLRQPEIKEITQEFIKVATNDRIKQLLLK
ncbi:MAG: LysR family transcriptional regulator [Lentilactobacillus diolivorans]|jgi:DNA-binding transcriptional LysR family regulator|nr:LysR family transcriptional regulator [Lentilactobacillus diolivorans]RRG04397.1 MAG: LysR family transcriptional regulator [Lactobacillus sp.]